MISPTLFLSSLEHAGIGFFTGVPDSLLKDFCACVTAGCPPFRHQIATNEGAAVAMAIGHHLATRQLSLVYMQNSGLGNAVNPLVSLASREVYAIPMLLMIGWRGEILPDGRQLHDEPQHLHQGKITLSQLDLLQIPWVAISAQTSDAEAKVIMEQLVAKSRAISGPVALVVCKGAFNTFQPLAAPPSAPLSREDAIRIIITSIPQDSPVVATTGMASRELYELRNSEGQSNHRDFLTVGGMGHAAQIAAGIARFAPEYTVVCIDGDGAMLMHTGAQAISSGCPNLLHILVNNHAHDSVGGQPTPQERTDLCAVACALGYEHVARAEDAESLSLAIAALRQKTGSRFLEVMCRKGARANLGRPAETPIENKKHFMDFLSHD